MMRRASNSLKILTLSGLIIAAGSYAAVAQKQYDIGVSDTEKHRALRQRRLYGSRC